MKKLLLRTMVLLCALVVGSLNGWAENTYEKVTATSQLTAGEKYLIVYEGTNSAACGALSTTSTKYGLSIGVTISSSTITINEEAVVAFELGGSSGAWTFKNGSNYLTWSSGNSLNQKNTATSNNEKWTIAISDGVTTITNNATSGETTRYLKYNSSSGQQRFACYTSGQQNISLYKKQASTKTATTVTINGTPSTEVYMGDAVTSPTGATVKAGETTVGTTVTWSSSNTNAATINSSTGAISIQGPGSTTIKATFAETSTHQGSEASYTLNVYGIFTTMAELQAGCAAYGTTALKGKMTFNNVYVTAVKGNNAYISDGTNGAVIYKSSHGFAAGDKLASSALEMTMMNYNNYTPEITSLTKTTEGLTVTSGSEITPTSLAVNAITTANFGTLVKITSVTYDATNKVFKDASSNEIAYYDNFSASPTLNDGEEYDVTGVILFKNNTTVEICPRSAADVVAKTVKTTPTSNWKVGSNVITSIAVTKGGTVSATFETNSTGTKSFASSQESVATVSNTGVISLAGAAGIATITATTEANAAYYSSSAPLTVIVGEAVEDGVFNFGNFQDYGSGIIPGDSYYTDEATWTAGNITLKTTGKYRWFIANTGTPDLRLYGNTPNSTMVVSAPDGYVITKIDGVSSNLTASTGTISSTTWKGKSQSVTFTYEATSSSVTISSLTVHYSEPTINVTMGSEGYMTYCNQNASISFDNTLTAYKVTAVDSEVHMTEVTTVPANTPVVLKGAAGSHTITILESSTTTTNDNQLRRSTGSTTTDDSYDIYALAKKNAVVGFYHVKAGTNVPAGKCYIRIAKSNSAREFLGFAFDDEATGVNEMKAQKVDGQVYDLQGRKVTTPSKGLYIVNGKKVVIK